MYTKYKQCVYDTTGGHDRTYKDIHPPHFGPSILQIKRTPGMRVLGHGDDKQHMRDFCIRPMAPNSQGMGGTDQPSAASHARSATPSVQTRKKKANNMGQNRKTANGSQPRLGFRRDALTPPLGRTSYIYTCAAKRYRRDFVKLSQRFERDVPEPCTRCGGRPEPPPPRTPPISGFDNFSNTGWSNAGAACKPPAPTRSSQQKAKDKQLTFC